MRKSQARIFTISVIIEVLTLICVCSSFWAMYSWFVPLDLGRFVVLTRSSVRVFSNPDFINGHYVERIGCIGQSGTKTNWINLDSDIVRKIPGPSSVKHFFYFPPAKFNPNLEWHSQYVTKILKLAYCRPEIILHLHCFGSEPQLGVQKFNRKKGDYKTITFRCPSYEKL